MASGLSQFEFRNSFFKRNDEDIIANDEEEDEEEEEDNEEEEEEHFKVTYEDERLQEAKAYLSKHKMYDHLAKVLVNIFDFRPRDAVDIFESLSIEAKKKLSSESEESLSQSEINTQVSLAQIQKKLYKIPENEDEEQDENKSQAGDMLSNLYYFEQAGIGLNNEELFKIFLAVKNLVAEKSVVGARLWGKIFGLEQNYIIIEADSGEGDEDEEEEEEEEEVEEDVEATELDEEEEEEVLPLPKLDYKPPPEVPPEETGTGTNKKIYYVCNDPGKFWTKLPDVTPKQITTAKKITKFFTGRLDAPVISYPPFPGSEINFLRAQIARISAATQISPVGYYIAGEGDDEELPTSVSENPDFEPLSMGDLFKMSLAGWVHHVEYILPQGRCSWWNPTSESEEPEEGEEEENTKEPPQVVPQVGPPLLTSLSVDSKMHGLAPWSIELPSIVSLNDGVVAVHSNLWVGAHAIYTGKVFENIYVGWGVKNSIKGYNPPMPTYSAMEYAAGPDLTEVNDPTVEEEFPKELKEEEENEGDDIDEDERGSVTEAEDEDTDEDQS